MMDSEEHFARAKSQFKPDVFRKLNNLFMDYNKPFIHNEQEDEETFTTIMSALTRYELDVNYKIVAQLSSTEKDAQLLQQHIHDLEATLEKQQQQLKQLEQTLENERVNLIRRREYDTLSEAILKYEDRTSQSEKRNSLRQHLEGLEKENSKLIQLIELRHKQFAFLMNTINELTTTFETQEELTPSTEVITVVNENEKGNHSLVAEQNEHIMEDDVIVETQETVESSDQVKTNNDDATMDTTNL